MQTDVVVYRIDRNDILEEVSSSWGRFARENGWSSKIDPDQVIGRSLWDFIAGAETEHLYRSLLERVRRNGEAGPIPFRCDSPAERRFLKLTLVSLEGGDVRFSSRLVRTESRQPVELLERRVEERPDALRICSMCKKMVVPEGEWLEIEEGLARVGLFEADVLSRLSHGVCPDCFHTAAAEIDSLGSSHVR